MEKTLCNNPGSGSIEVAETMIIFYACTHSNLYEGIFLHRHRWIISKYKEKMLESEILSDV